MTKSEIAEIKKQFTHTNSSITKICGCYVDGEKEIKTKLQETFLCLPEEETFKYFEILKKTLSGTIGKNLLNLDFPMKEEFEGGTQDFLLRLRNSELKDEAMIDEFFERMIQIYDYVGNYLILLVYGNYDIPGKSSDRIMLEDASDEVYSHVLCSICPVNLSKPGLSYNPDTKLFQGRIQDWVVGTPLNGFLFPAYNDRSTDIHSVLYYSKDSDELKDEFVGQMFGCEVPLSAGIQKQAFQELLEETLGDDCEYDVIRNIHEKISEIIEENKDMPEPATLNKAEVKTLLTESGVSQDKLAGFDDSFEEKAGGNKTLQASNLINTRTFEVKTADVVIKVNPDRLDLVETKMVDGRKCIVIAVSDQVEVNGINVKTIQM
ncbi:DUF4317 domain-containing protein [Parasporobacterium paucivorans]|uniref:DUF4317 domain-containing protein n=1 Tax=Parasporobacterium paucivorans DSM 15970 TaxID=1122934 RepID=A0A1M6EP07_9FIRM|nr:DUF4317 domain-containing protein [Parasporobacterium paucivorans]SHI87163.1 protein of unknown function [Parasporobacterium paucivorans DSM 15970]